jgi:hypothetical protein
MPWIVSVLLGGLLQLVGSFLGRAIVALGFGYVEYVGISAAVDSVKNQAGRYIGGLSGSMLSAWAGFFRIDVHITIIISAIGVKILLNALNGDKVRRLIQK